MNVIIGTRGSALALKQVEIVSAALKAVDTSVVIETRIIETKGDLNLSPIPLDTVGKGWFTHEIEEELAAGHIDLAVHSLKDMAEVQPDGLSIAAYLSREDARDALVSRHGETLADLTHGAVIGTDSIRRGVQLRAMRADIVVKSMRGNVPTRVAKVENDYDAAVLAVAGLNRLGMQGKIAQIFSIDEITPAPGQGILAVQARDGDQKTRALLAHVNEATVAGAAVLERAFARAAGGGCKSPVGAYACRENGGYRLRAMIATDDGSKIVRDSEFAATTEPGISAALAARMLAQLPHA